MGHFKKIKAFTLLEIIITLGIFALFVSIALPFSLNQMQNSGIEKETYDVTSQLFLQQQHSYSRLNNIQYGISFENNTITLFEGGDTLSTSTYSEVIELSQQTTINQISLSNSATEFVFALGQINPSESGYVQLTNGTITYNIKINTEGLIETEKL